MSKCITIEEAHKLSVGALCAHNTSVDNAEAVARALVAAEADGLTSHGLYRLPSYCRQAASGKVAGQAVPSARLVATAALRVDAAYGFSYPAIELAVRKLIPIASRIGIGVAAITRSHHCGALGYHVEALARHNLMGLMFSNTPKAIAPWGGRYALFGTNPIAFAAPRRTDDPLVIDLSLSKVARGKILVAEQRGGRIPEGWALDANGRPATDPKAALSGTMLPIGGAKGAALAMMVEILAAALSGSNFGFEAGSFFSDDGLTSGVGHLIIAIAPGPLSNHSFEHRLDELLATALDQPQTRLPGDLRRCARQRASTEGVFISNAIYAQIHALAASPRGQNRQDL